MAYQNVGTPRFYIDVFSTMKALDIPYTEGYEYGLDAEPIEPLYQGLWGLENLSMPNWDGNIHYEKIKVKLDTEGASFSDLLGDGSRENIYISFINYKIGEWGEFNIYPQFPGTGHNILGSDFISSNNIWTSSPWGSSIISWRDVDMQERVTIDIYPAINTTESHIGGISIGNMYDMPVSPDLNLSMNIEFDGYDNTKTLNGSTLTNTRYMGSPWWYDNSGNKIEPWANYSEGEVPTGVSKRNGRRTWNLKFSYMSDKDLFASNYGSSTYAEEGNLTEIGYDPGDVDEYNWGQELVTNGTMETNDYWREYAASTQEQSDDQAKSGTYSWKFIPSSVDDGMQIKGNAYFTSKVGTLYRVTGYVYINSSNHAQNFRIKTYNGDLSKNNSSLFSLGGGLHSDLNFELAEDSWHPFEIYYTEETGGDNSRVAFTSSLSTAGNYYVDNVSIVASNPTDFQYTIDDDDSFSAQVLNKISHGQKFIFQPDNTNANPDQFAICVLDQDSFSMKRTAHNVYDISMKIKEVW